MRMFNDILCIVQELHNADQDSMAHDGRIVQRIRSGMNNALYRVELGGQTFACKLCVKDERRRVQREYNALRLIESRSLDIAPKPLVLDESCSIVPYPAVVYTWQEGEPFGSVPTQDQLAALLVVLVRQLGCRPLPDDDPGLVSAWFHWFDRGPYLRELHELLDLYGKWLAKQPPNGRDLCNRLHLLVEKSDQDLWHATVELSLSVVQRRLCHVDPNLANAIWCPDGAVRWVDWEYSGWGDPALELADFRWHIASAEISQDQHNWLRAQIGSLIGDKYFTQRLAFWDRLLVTRWPFLILRRLWSAINGPDRVRLNKPTADLTELWGQLNKLIERAEAFKKYE